MKIFDEKPRRYGGPAAHTEDTFTYLDRSGRPAAVRVRSELEKWFSRLPDGEKAGFRGRIRTEFRAAFFELFIHEVLLRSGFSVTHHPRVSGTERRPDFGVEGSDGAFLLEAVLSQDQSQEAESQEAVKQGVYDEINKIDSPDCFLRVRRLDISDGVQPAGRRIRAFLARKLSGIDPEALASQLTESGLDGLPCWGFEDQGISLQIQPVPKSPGLRGESDVRPIGIYPIESRMGGSAPSIRSSLFRKAGRYGAPDRPFIIAVNTLGLWGADRIEVMEALFGTEQFVIGPDDKEPEMMRAPDGLFHGPRGPQYTRVSAVLVASVVPWNIPRAPVELIHNPWAAKPLSEGLLGLHESVPDEGRMLRRAGRTISEVLGLPEDWPEPEKERP